MQLSIVTTLYHSAPYINEFYRRTIKTLSRVTTDFEIIYVNDGSPDDSLELVVSLHNKDNRVKVLDLSRNFGHHKAIMAGLKYAQGQFVFLIDCDLEEPPELIADFYKYAQKAPNIDVHYGVQGRRKGGWFERVSGFTFYKLFNMLSGLRLDGNPLTIRLMSKRYVDALLLHEEEELFLAGVFELTGFQQRAVVITKNDKGKSTYGIMKKFQLLVKGITSFSSLPLVFFFYCGCVISVSSFLYAFYLAIVVLLGREVVGGWTSLMVSIWFLSGIILIGLGVVGIYLSRVYYEVKRRPNYIVRRSYGEFDG